MKVICPEHQGVIYVPGDFLPGNKNMVIECPVCNEQVLINDTHTFDSEKPPVNNQFNKKQFLK